MVRRRSRPAMLILNATDADRLQTAFARESRLMFYKFNDAVKRTNALDDLIDQDHEISALAALQRSHAAGELEAALALLDKALEQALAYEECHPHRDALRAIAGEVRAVMDHSALTDALAALSQGLGAVLRDVDAADRNKAQAARTMLNLVEESMLCLRGCRLCELRGDFVNDMLENVFDFCNGNRQLFADGGGRVAEQLAACEKLCDTFVLQLADMPAVYAWR